MIDNELIEDLDEIQVSGIAGAGFIGNDIDLKYTNAISKKINYGNIIFTPIIYNSIKRKYQKVIKFKIQVKIKDKPL